MILGTGIAVSALLAAFCALAIALRRAHRGLDALLLGSIAVDREGEEQHDLSEANRVLQRRTEFAEERTRELELLSQQLAATHALSTEIQASLARHADELERTNKDLELFAYVASHDLQEPLRMVASYTQLLAREYGPQLDDNAREFIGYAVDGAKRMQRLLSDLLEYSRAGTREKAVREVDCNAILEQVLSGLVLVIEETSATVTSDELPTVSCDEMQIAQVFQNLVENAMKFRGVDSPRIHLSAERHGDEWVFSVADNGIGIDSEHRERVFVLFQRLHEQEAHPGSGIGLAICKKLVERHKGRIWIDDGARPGTTIKFAIPCEAPSDSDKRGRIPAPGSSSAVTAPRTQSSCHPPENHQVSLKEC